MAQLTRVRSSSQDWWHSLKNEMDKKSFTKETMSDLYNDLFSSLGHRNPSSQGTFHRKFLQVRRRFCFCDSGCLNPLRPTQDVLHSFKASDLLTHLSVLQKFANKVEKLLGANGITLFQKRREKSFVRQVDALEASMRGFQKEPGNLKEYSPWLSGFKADTLGNELEVPGEPGAALPDGNHFC